MLFFLGVGDRVVGVTYECNEPASAAELPQVTDTILPPDATPDEIDRLIGEAMAAGQQLYTLDRELLADLDPDLIVTQDLCRVCALPAGDVEAAVADLGCTSSILAYDPKTLDGVLDEIELIGKAVDAPAMGKQKIQDLRVELAGHRAISGALADRPRVLLLEWPDPPYTPGHWIPDQIEAAGGEALLAHPGGRSSATSWDEIAATAADVLIVAPCGFDHAAATEQLKAVVARPELAELPAIRNGRCYAIDADAWIVRPGPRLVEGVEQLRQLIFAKN